MNQKWVKKASGEIVEFDEAKFHRSLFNSGTSEELIDKIQKILESEFDEITSTKQIYKKAYQILRSSSQKLAGKYKLKTAILELGPSGYPFETFIGRLFEHQGFKVQVGVEMEGRCLTHEVDILAQRNKTLIIGECKHHGNPGYKSDVKVPLYVHSRYNDIENGLKQRGDNNNLECWIIINTRFTTDALDYANCYGLKLMAWDHPSQGSLKERIEISGLYPITCLYSLTKKEKSVLMDKDIVLCKQLLDNPDLLQPIDKRKHLKILKESSILCKG